MKLEAHLRARRDSGRKLLVPYLTGGLGEDWLDCIRAAMDAGADAIELGIPFSDPVMDGPTIQAASQQALDQGATPPSILAEVARLDATVPLVVMTYYNLAAHGGHTRFARLLSDSGVDAAILPDLAIDELDGGWSAAATAAGIETVLLAAPPTPDDRMARICERSQGFVYGVSLLGVTGERAALAPQALTMGQRLMRAANGKPALLGVGISSAAHAVEACTVVDGVVIGSAVVRAMLDGRGPIGIGQIIGDVRNALDSG